jgi:hypothetical protein
MYNVSIAIRYKVYRQHTCNFTSRAFEYTTRRIRIRSARRCEYREECSYGLDSNTAMMILNLQAIEANDMN